MINPFWGIIINKLCVKNKTEQVTVILDLDSFNNLLYDVRIHTITGGDRVLVLEAGRIVEEGSPADLLANSNSRYLLASQSASRSLLSSQSASSSPL